MNNQEILNYTYHTLHSMEKYLNVEKKKDVVELDFNNPQFLLNYPLFIKHLNENLVLPINTTLILMPLTFRTDDFYHGKKIYNDLFTPLAIPIKRIHGGYDEQSGTWQVLDWPFVPRQHYTLTEEKLTEEHQEKLIFWNYSQIANIVKKVEPFYRTQKNEEKLHADWTTYIQTILKLLSQSIPDALTKNKMKNGCSYVEFENIPPTARYILPAIKDNKKFALLEKFFNEQKKIDVPNYQEFNNLIKHSGQIKLNSESAIEKNNPARWFGMAKNQRIALGVREKEDGNILCLNGPPGTGKTTWIQSIFASLFVENTVNRKDYSFKGFNNVDCVTHKPLLVFGTSHTNQAIMNIINAFGLPADDLMTPIWGKRWLSKLLPYGAYYSQNAKEDLGFENIFSTITNPDFCEASERVWVQNAQLFLGEETSSLGILTAKLLEKIKEKHKEFERFCSVSDGILSDKIENIEERYKVISNFIIEHKDLKKNYQKIKKSYDEKYLIYSKENVWWHNILAKFGFVQKTVSDEFVVTNQNTLDQMKKQIKSLDNNIEQFKTLEQKFRKVKEIKRYPDLENCSDIETYMDNVFRYQLFQLSMRYWEGMFLLFMKNNYGRLEKNAGFSGQYSFKTNRYLLTSMLCPINIVTLHSIGKYFHSSNKSKDFINYEEIDWLFIDEAGQLNAEKVVLPLMLTKNVVVVGDDLQIKPIISLNEAIDEDNLKASKVSESDPSKHFFTHSNPTNSVIKIAQKSNPFHQYPKLSAGMYLLEHRRCPEQIIKFNNEACYQGLLIPKKENKPSEELILRTHWGYLDVKGHTAKVDGSKINEKECVTIIKYLHKHWMLFNFSEPKDTIAFLSPFIEQKELFRKTLNQYIQNERMSEEEQTFMCKLLKCVCGTVHALQGSEMPIIFFMLTDSESSHFIDSDPSILNVATSRAKESFIVVGNLNILEGKYSSVLKKYLAEYGKDIEFIK